jgi:hypothetical protein
MGRNGKQSPARPRIEVRQSASPEEAAAIAAAIEQFMRDTTPALAPPGGLAMSPWLRAGLYAGTGRDPASATPWGEPERWGTG